MPTERLHKVLATAGVASRRHAEAMIQEGRVAVNGEVVTQMGLHVDPDVDEVTVDGMPVTLERRLAYLVLHKPVGYITTRQDPGGRPTVMDLVPADPPVYPVGRLDSNSEGLLLLLNNGELAFRLTHPSYGIEREYHALVEGEPDPHALAMLRRGVRLEDGMTAPAQANILRRESGVTWVRLTLHEGKKREVRRMCEAVGHPVRRLIRVRVGPIQLGELPPGRYRYLEPEEVRALRRLVGM